MSVILALMVSAAKPEIGLVIAPLYLLYTLWAERRRMRQEIRREERRIRHCGGAMPAELS